MSRNKYSNWRDDLREVVDATDVKPKTDTESEKEITEKKVKNKIVINPTMKEAFEEIGGTILEVVELDEVLDMKTADMGEVIKDFRKSDAPQFKGKSKEKKRQMAIAAKLSAEDDVNEGNCMDKAPSIKDTKPQKKTDVKYYKGLGYAPTVKKEELSIDDQMRISRDYNRKSPEEKRELNKKAMGTIKKMATKKDTRTDAQKMTDATGPRPGSRYRGD